MDHLPLTCSAPFEDVPDWAMETLFPELAVSGTRRVEVLVTVPGEGHRTVMDVVAAEEDAERAVLMAYRQARKLGGYEVTVRPFTG